MSEEKSVWAAIDRLREENADVKERVVRVDEGFKQHKSHASEEKNRLEKKVDTLEGEMKEGFKIVNSRIHAISVGNEAILEGVHKLSESVASPPPLKGWARPAVWAIMTLIAIIATLVGVPLAGNVP